MSEDRGVNGNSKEIREMNPDQPKKRAHKVRIAHPSL